MPGQLRCMAKNDISQVLFKYQMMMFNNNANFPQRVPNTSANMLTPSSYRIGADYSGMPQAFGTPLRPNSSSLVANPGHSHSSSPLSQNSANNSHEMYSNMLNPSF